MLAHKRPQVVLGKARNALGWAKDRATECLFGKGLFLEPIKHDVIGRVIGHADLLQDHAALYLDVFVAKSSIASAICKDVRRAVPLNAICSRKCAMPFCSTRSCRPPACTQTPIEADFSPGICSVTIRNPFDRVCV